MALHRFTLIDVPDSPGSWAAIAEYMKANLLLEKVNLDQLEGSFSDGLDLEGYSYSNPALVKDFFGTGRKPFSAKALREYLKLLIAAC